MLKQKILFLFIVISICFGGCKKDDGKYTTGSGVIWILDGAYFDGSTSSIGVKINNVLTISASNLDGSINLRLEDCNKTGTYIIGTGTNSPKSVITGTIKASPTANIIFNTNSSSGTTINVVITEYTNTFVKGTFIGTVRDSNNKVQQLTKGSFSVQL